MRQGYLLILSLAFVSTGVAQRVPNEVENIDYLVTYGTRASTSFGDDDHVQIIFFSVPLTQKLPIYIRVYDPDTGGLHDEIHGSADTRTRISVYGGNETFSNKNAQKVNPSGNYNSGNLLASKIFSAEKDWDNKWYTFGPFNPLQGEQSEAMGGLIFKLIIEGLEGDDGNQYRCFLSEQSSQNTSIEGSNAFAYEYTFKLPKGKSISHIYPFIDKLVLSITQYNFDYDNDGEILIYTVAKNRHKGAVSGNDEWAKSKHLMVEEEKNTTLDLQLYKAHEGESALSVYITNQYDEAIPFFAIPIGGPPKYKYDLKLSRKPSSKK